MQAILHILDHSLPLQSGYTFRTRAIMKAQAASGLMVEGLTGVRHYQPGDVPGPAHENVDGLSFHRTIAAPSSLPVYGEAREVALLAARAAAVRGQFPYSLIHAHSPVLNGLAGLIAARRAHVPFVYEIRAFWEDAAVGNGTGTQGSARYRATRAMETFMCRRADAVVVICEGLRADLIARGIDAAKIMVSPNGVDMGVFGAPGPYDGALAATLGLGPGRAVLGFIGSFYDYEGLDDLIAAMPMLAARGVDADLLLVGGGPREAALRAQAAASPAAKTIIFAGRVPHDAVEKHYGLTDVLVYPRKQMRLTDLVTPLKPLEAMAQRRLVAASDVGGHRELIKDGVTGTLFAPDNPAALADKVAALLADRGQWDAMRDRAEDYVRTERNWAHNITRYEPLYARLIAGRRGAMKDRP